jgi:hypothetical protein
LGAGSGIVGLSCARLGAKKVELTDVDSGVLSRLNQNIDYNGFLGSDSNAEGGNKVVNVDVAVSSLDWEHVTDAELETKRRYLNVDLIIATDVIYDPIIIPPLVRVLRGFLVNENDQSTRFSLPVALVSTTLRSPTTYSLFMAELEKADLQFEELSVERMPGLYYYDEATPISLIRVFRKL